MAPIAASALAHAARRASPSAFGFGSSAFMAISHGHGSCLELTSTRTLMGIPSVTFRGYDFRARAGCGRSLGRLRGGCQCQWDMQWEWHAARARQCPAGAGLLPAPYSTQYMY
jgi:hypothetical protein